MGKLLTLILAFMGKVYYGKIIMGVCNENYALTKDVCKHTQIYLELKTLKLSFESIIIMFRYNGI